MPKSAVQVRFAAVLWLVAAPWMIAWRSDDEERDALRRAAGSDGIRALFAR